MKVSELHERAIRDWIPHESNIAQHRPIMLGQIERLGQMDFNPITGELRTNVPSAQSNGGWWDRPDYSPKETSMSSPTSGALFPLTMDYLTTIRWPNWWDFFLNYYNETFVSRQNFMQSGGGIFDDEESPVDVDNEFSGLNVREMVGELVENMDVQFHCTCPSFYWQGMQRDLGDIGAAIHPHNNPDTDWWDNFIYVRNPICKHIAAVVTYLSQLDSDTFYRQMILPSREMAQEYIRSQAY